MPPYCNVMAVKGRLLALVYQNAANPPDAVRPRHRA